MASLIAGNWKMNGLRADGLALTRALVERMLVAAADPGGPEILICPPATLLAEIAGMIASSGIRLGGQDCHAEASGAHTGDLSAAMLKDAGCAYVIVGHSERRLNHGETDGTVRFKAARAIASALRPIICLGESEAERLAGIANAVVGRQIEESVPWAAAAPGLVLAYEPIWAIGTGRTPTPLEVAEMHGFINDRLAEHLGLDHGVRILYGGSVKPANAREFLKLPFVGGALVGGASLKADEFWAIAQACRDPSPKVPGRKGL